MNKSDRSTVQILEAKIFFPVTLALMLIFGLFQNCSSKFTQDVDPLEEQYREELAQAIVITDQAIEVNRLEGTSLFISRPQDLFLNQGVVNCTGARFDWTHTPEGVGAEEVVLSERSSLLRIDPVTLSSAGVYRLDVDCAGQLYNLGPLTLKVTPKLKLINTNVTDQTVNEGSPLNLNGQFQGPSDINYQWYITQDSGSRLALAGKTESELSVASVELSDQGVYELVATSTEGGFNQRVVAGPGKLTVVSMNSVTGNISGTTNVTQGQPISLTSTVNGSTDPTYQWYFNSGTIAGANTPDFSIPTSQLSDEGIYSLRVTDEGTEYLVGSLYVDVNCPSGQGDSSGSCVNNTQSCTIQNGVGIQFLENSGEYGPCKVVTCNSGYVNVDNKCLSFTGTCAIENGTGTYTLGADGKPGECVVQSCNPGYLNINNSCQQKSCPVENGVGLLKEEGSSLVCEIEYCHPNFVKYNDQCVPNRRTCTVENGVGYQDVTESGPGECMVQVCNNGFVNLNNQCVSSICNIVNGQGVLALASNGSVQCRAVSCNPGFILFNNQCSSQSCSSNGGTGMLVEEGGQLVCKLNRCNSPDQVVVNNQCVSSACAVPNGRGAVALDENSEVYCKVISCNPGYAINNNTCIAVDGQPCPIDNGVGVSTDGGTKCEVQSCNPGYVPYNNTCVKENDSCSIDNGVGKKVYSYDGSWTCEVQSCNSGFVQNGNQCVSTETSCYIENGVGYQKVFANGFSQCMVKSCNLGYGVTITQQCLPLQRPCYIGSGQGVQYLTAYGYTACKVESCPAGQTELMGVCRVNERLLCEPTDPAKSAYGGKVFGLIYSLLNNKGNANINTAIESQNRVNGQVYLKKMSFSSGKTFLYDVSNQKAKHRNGTFIRDWFGLKLYSRVLPPDGQYSGNYIFALASDDGSALDCKLNGTWRTFVNNNGGRSCNNIKAASEAIYITRNTPMPIRVRYFHNSGASRCLKLLYKRAGTNDSFKEVPQQNLILPFDTTNRCPQGAYN